MTRMKSVQVTIGGERGGGEGADAEVFDCGDVQRLRLRVYRGRGIR